MSVNELIPPSHKSSAVGLYEFHACGPVELTLPYTTPDIHCRHRRHECDRGISEANPLLETTDLVLDIPQIFRLDVSAEGTVEFIRI